MTSAPNGPTRTQRPRTAGRAAPGRHAQPDFPVTRGKPNPDKRVAAAAPCFVLSHEIAREDTRTRPERQRSNGGWLVGEILVEVRPAHVTGDVARKSPALPESFASRAAELADTITGVSADLRDHLEANMAGEDTHLWRLASVQLSFELALQAEAGVVIARASTGATFSATLTWSKG